jgi:hypothetical protein
LERASGDFMYEPFTSLEGLTLPGSRLLWRFGLLGSRRVFHCHSATLNIGLAATLVVCNLFHYLLHYFFLVSFISLVRIFYIFYLHLVLELKVISTSVNFRVCGHFGKEIKWYSRL